MKFTNSIDDPSTVHGTTKDRILAKSDFMRVPFPAARITAQNLFVKLQFRKHSATELVS